MIRATRLHIHVQPGDHPAVAGRRAVRDRLRTDPELRSAYMQGKQEILAAGTTEPIAHTAAKADSEREATVGQE